MGLVMGEVRENHDGMALNGTHQFLDYADNVNMLGEIINTIKRNTECLLEDCREGGLQLHTQEMECVAVSC
jgi:hypothetical protein